MDNGKLSLDKVTVNIDQQRLIHLVTVDQFLRLNEGDLPTIVEVMTHCVWNTESKEYVPIEKARPLIGTLTIAQLLELSGALQEYIEDQAVPKESVPE